MPDTLAPIAPAVPAPPPVTAELVRASDALFLQRDPRDMLAEATKAARALMEVMQHKPDKVMMNGEQYIENEDWQTIGHFYGATAQLESDRYVEFGEVKGWEATMVLVARDGRLLGRASAMCLNDEEKWSSRRKYVWAYVKKSGGHSLEDPGPQEIMWVKRSDGKPGMAPKKARIEVGGEPVPLFQLRSMAQTRASSRVHRSVLGFVPVLAGFNATPAEELDADAERVPNAPRTFRAEAQQIADQYTTPTPDAEPEDARDAPEVHGVSADRAARLSPGVALITGFTQMPTKNPNVHRYTLTVVGGPSWPANMTSITTVNEQMASIAENAWHSEQAVAIRTNKSKFGYELSAIEYARERPAPVPVVDPEAPMVTHDQIPFGSAGGTGGPGPRRE